MPVDVRRSADRFVTRRPGSTTWHSFSFGTHYDPDNVAFGPVVAVNDEVVLAGAGFDDHPHQGIVIVTLVVSGSLVHQGISSCTVEAGQVAVQRTGTGVVHAERNGGSDELRFVQTWITTGDPTVSYGVVDGPVAVDDVTVVAGQVPAQTFTGHLFVATGTVRVGDLQLTGGDSLRADEPLLMQPDDGSQVVLVLR